MLLLWRHGVEWDCDVIADVDNGWGECIVPIGSEIYALNVRFDSRRILSYFLYCFIFHVIKGIKNGCPCIVEIRGTQGCALATSLHSPTARAGSPTKAQPCVPLISTMHGQPFLIPLIKLKSMGPNITWHVIMRLVRTVHKSLAYGLGFGTSCPHMST